jgi:hypothetical protein
MIAALGSGSLPYRYHSDQSGKLVLVLSPGKFARLLLFSLVFRRFLTLSSVDPSVQIYPALCSS